MRAVSPLSTRWLLLLSFALGAVGLLLLGQDGGFDIKNYHWHNAWALLHGRGAIDLAPAQLQGFFNPLLDLPTWFLVHALGPAAGLAVLGGLHGLVFAVLVLLGRQLRLPEPWALGLAALGFGPVAYASHGGSSGDAWIALLELAGLLLLLRRKDAASGAMPGAAVALKPVAMIWDLGLGLALLVVRDPRRLLRWGLGSAAAWLVLGAWWHGGLWLEYGNPIFPNANDVFGSPWAPDTSYLERRFHPPTGLEHLLFPLRIAQGGEVAWEFAWRDARYGLLFVAAAAGLAKASEALRTATLACLGAWVAWQLNFCLIRYLYALELVAPLMVAALAAGLHPRGRWVALALLLANAGWMRAPNVERLPWAPTLFEVQVPDVLLDDALVVFAGDDAITYLLPELAPTATFARLSGNIAHWDEDTRLNAAVAGTIRAWPGRIWLLEGPKVAPLGALVVHGLERDGACATIASRVDADLQLCPLVRARLTPWPPPEPTGDEPAESAEPDDEPAP